MSHLVRDLEEQLSSIARNMREPARLRDGRVVPRSTASLLYVLDKQEPMRVGAVAAALNLDPSTTTRQVQHAMGLGLLARVEDPRDRRAGLIIRTELGRDLGNTLIREQREWLGCAIGNWPEEDQHALIRLLTVLNAEIEACRPDGPRNGDQSESA